MSDSILTELEHLGVRLAGRRCLQKLHRVCGEVLQPGTEWKDEGGEIERAGQPKKKSRIEEKRYCKA